MNIGIFTDTYKPNINGVVTSIDIKKRELEKLGNKVYIFAPEEPGYDEKEADVIRLKSFTLMFQPEYRQTYVPSIQVLKQIEKLNLNIIHAETPFSLGLIATYIAKKDKIPLIHTYHTLFPEYVHYLKMPVTVTKPLAEKISAMFCNACDYIIAPSSEVKNELERYGVKKPVAVIPTGIDVNNFQSGKKEVVFERFKLDKDTKILLFVGRLGKEKNIDFLLDAFKIIKSKLPKEKLKVLLVGDGPYRAGLEEKAVELKIKDEVLFAGYIKREEIADYYAASELFVFSSLTETQGLVILEAMASGIPCVAVKASGVEDMITDGYSGFLTNNDLEDFSDKVVLLLKNDELRKVIQKNAKVNSFELTPESTFKKMFDIYSLLYEYSNRIKLRKALKIRKNKARAMFSKLVRRKKK